MAVTPIASGVGGQLLGVVEATFGVAPSLASPVCWEFNSETLSLKKTTVQGRGLHAGGRHDRGKRRVLTNYDAGGGIDMDLPTRNLNTLLKLMMGSFDQTSNGPSGTPFATNGNLVANGDTTQTATHIPGSNIGSSLTIQKGIPTVDGVIEPFTYVGCKALDWTISVATGQIAKLQLNIDARNELGAFPVTTPAMPATTVTVTNTAIGPVSVVITGGTLTQVKVNAIVVGTTAGTYTVPAGQTISITYTVAPTWVWSAASYNSDPLNAGAPQLQPWVDVQTNLFHFREAALVTGGTASTTSNVTTIAGGTTNTNIKNATIKYQLPIANKRYNLGSSGFKLEQVDNGFRQITGSFEIEWLSSESMYAAFANDTPTALQLNFVGAPIGTSTRTELLQILVPYIKLDGEAPQIPGPDVVSQKVTFTGLDDEVNNPIQIVYTTLDTV